MSVNNSNTFTIETGTAALTGGGPTDHTTSIELNSEFSQAPNVVVTPFGANSNVHLIVFNVRKDNGKWHADISSTGGGYDGGGPAVEFGFMAMGRA
mgnify:CR=1 FL=1